MTKSTRVKKEDLAEAILPAYCDLTHQGLSWSSSPSWDVVSRSDISVTSCLEDKYGEMLKRQEVQIEKMNQHIRVLEDMIDYLDRKVGILEEQLESGAKVVALSKEDLPFLDLLTDLEDDRND